MRLIRIVVIEDDADLREALCFILRDRGHEVSGFSNAKEAIRQLEDGLAADLIVLDLMMPVMSGWEFCDYRARSTALANIPVIVITARQKISPPDGVADVLLKPFHIDKLQEAITRVVG